MKQDRVKNIFTAFLLALILPTAGRAQGFWEDSGATTAYDYNNTAYSYEGYPYAYSRNSYEGDIYGNDYPLYDSSPIDYYHDYQYRVTSQFGRTDGYLHFGRKFDNSDNFSSGISSYQGTSTGPGPNGGYPGTPHGTYQTNYFNTSIYPNTYMRISPSY